MKVELINWTLHPEMTIVTAAKQCYNGVDASEISSKLDNESVGKFVSKLANTGHTPIEHSTFTFAVDGISRACSHQLVRHRMASYSQQSQRYVTENNFLDSYVTPSSIATNKCEEIYRSVMEHINEAYANMVANGVPKEDARYVLPNATSTKIVVTMNARSLMHFFNLRCCTRSQWEIRELANEMLRLVKYVAPNLFAKAGARCEQYGICLEEHSCGRVRK